jgi:hypothetical protein
VLVGYQACVGHPRTSCCRGRRFAYSGPFQVDESTGDVHHEVRVSLLPNWLNGTQLRHAKLGGDHLTLSASTAAPDGSEILSTVLWKRAPNHPL